DSFGGVLERKTGLPLDAGQQRTFQEGFIVSRVALHSSNVLEGTDNHRVFRQQEFRWNGCSVALLLDLSAQDQPIAIIQTVDADVPKVEMALQQVGKLPKNGVEVQNRRDSAADIVNHNELSSSS